MMFDWFHCVMHTSFFLIHFGLYYFVCVVYSEQRVYFNYPKLVLTSSGMIFLHVTIRMQISELLLTKFNSFRKTALISWAILLSNLYFQSDPNYKKYINEAYVHVLIIIIATFDVFHMILNVIDELKKILNINVFSIKNKEEKVE